MSDPACTGAIPFATLIEYWFEELAHPDEQRVEEHLLGCAHCARQLARLVELGSGIRSAFSAGFARVVISPPFFEKMKKEGMHVREYPVSPGDTVHCTISAADDAVIGRLRAPLEGLRRLDLVSVGERGEVRFHLTDIPFNPASGEVLFCPSAASLRKLPAHTNRIRLLAVDSEGERPIADYTFVHTPS